MSLKDNGAPGTSWLRFYGEELQLEREASGMTLRQLASHTTYSFQQLCNVEAARRTPSEALSRELDAALETKGRFQRILQRVLEDPFPEWFRGAAREEQLATRIRTYQAQVVHGLFQTEDYARAMMRAGRPRESHDRLEIEIAARMDRQAIFTGEKPPLVWLILDEAVIRRPVGGRAVMTEQLERLLQAAESPSNVIQVLPYEAEAHTGLDGSFTIWSYGDRNEVLYTEGMLSGQLVEGEDKLVSANLSYDLLQAASLSRARSLEFIRSRLKEYGS